jgi:hypothetical protein
LSRQPHFNVETVGDAIVAQILAAGGVALVVIVVVLTLVSFRPQPAVPTAMRLAIRAGFVILVGAMATGGLQRSRRPGGAQLMVRERSAVVSRPVKQIELAIVMSDERDPLPLRHRMLPADPPCRTSSSSGTPG